MKMCLAQRVFVSAVCIGVSLTHSTAFSAWVFTSPSATPMPVYTKFASIAAAGTGPNNVTFTLACINTNGAIEGSTNGTSTSVGGYWGGTIPNPTGGWILDTPTSNHTLKVTGADGGTKTLTIKINP